MRNFILDFQFSCELELRKCLNSQTWQTHWTTKIMCGRWKSDQKLKKWTWLHMMRFSCSIMKKHVSFDSEMSFMIFGWNCVLAIHGEKSVSHGIRWKKKFWSWWKNDLICEKKWEVRTFILRKFFLTRPTWMEWKILKTQSKSSIILCYRGKIPLQ